jgi:hypothetical protein
MDGVWILCLGGLCASIRVIDDLLISSTIIPCLPVPLRPSGGARIEAPNNDDWTGSWRGLAPLAPDKLRP